MYEIISPKSVDAIWPFVCPWILQAIGEEDTWRDVDQIKENCRTGGARLIVKKDAYNKIVGVLVTESWIQDGKKILVLRWMSGKCVDEWIEDQDLFEGLAFSNGFQGIQIWGRPAWVKKLKPLGFTHEFTVVGKPLMRGLH